LLPTSHGWRAYQSFAAFSDQRGAEGRGFVDVPCEMQRRRAAVVNRFLIIGKRMWTPKSKHEDKTRNFHFDFPTDRKRTPNPFSLQCSSQVFEGRVFPMAAAKSQSQELTLPPPIPQTLFLFQFRSGPTHGVQTYKASAVFSPQMRLRN